MSRVFERKKSEWWIDFKDARGKRRRTKVGPNKRIAEEALNATLTKIARQEWVGVIEESKIGFSDFTKIWSDRILPTLRPKTAARWSGIVKNHLKPFFTGALRAIELGAIEKYTAARLEAGATPASTNREIGVLRHLLKRACVWKDENDAPYLKHYPLEEWKPLQEPSGRTRFLDETEIVQLLEACAESRSPYLRPFVLVALNTGCRRGEILSLTRDSIDWKRRTARLTGTKNGDDRIVNLNDVALEALRALPSRINGKLFPFRDEHSVSRAFRRAADRAELKDFRLHDLRHTFASHCAMNGVQARGLQALLGHRDSRMTTRYSHLSDDYLKRAVNAIRLGADTPISPAQEARDGS
jgi:integrase